MACEMLTVAFVSEGKYSNAFPMFGFERLCAPVSAFVRFDDKPIREKTQIYSPDCLIVLDRAQLTFPVTYAGLKPQGILVANAAQALKEKPNENVTVAGIVDATGIALEELGIPAFNTCMLGAFAATTQWLKLDSILSALERYFKGEMLRKNLKVVERGFHETKVVEWE